MKDPFEEYRKILSFQDQFDKLEKATKFSRMADEIRQNSVAGLLGDDLIGLRSGLLESEKYRVPSTAVRNISPRVGRNDPCPCGSGKKFKKCCGGR